MNSKITLLLIVFCTILLNVHSASVCSECFCPAEYDPLCAKQEDTGKLRGFSNMCVMNCSNMCAKKKYEFLKKGRCGTGAKRVIVNTGDSQRPSRTTQRPSLLFG